MCCPQLQKILSYSKTNAPATECNLVNNNNNKNNASALVRKTNNLKSRNFYSYFLHAKLQKAEVY